MELVRKEWPCADCGLNLGFVVGGEISILMTNVVNVTSQGVNTVLVCRTCGRQKSWFAKDQAVVEAFYKNLADTVANRLARLLGDNSGNR